MAVHTVKSAISAINDAEVRLREVAAKAAADGDYDSLSIVTRLAKALQSLTAEINGSLDEEFAPHEMTTPPGPTPSIESRGNVRGRDKSMKPSPGLPVFGRDADFLVKRARSRKTRGGYEHRAPVEVLTVVTECLAELRPAKKLLTADHLLEAYSKRRGSVLSYQVYVALGWLTQIGLVRRHDRSGYSVPSPTTIIQDAHRAWSALGALPKI